MALLLKNGSVFLHIPKTGGNWVTEVLTKMDLVDHPIGHKHADVSHLYTPPLRGLNNYLRFYLRQQIRPYFKKKTFLFTFVRHPLSWYESHFKYMWQSHILWRDWGNEHDLYNWHPMAVLNGLKSENFNDFMRKVNSKRPGYVTEMYSSYTTSMVDFVGRQENLKEDLIRVLSLMKIDFDPDFVRNYDKVGVSKSQSQVVWDENLREETLKLEYAGLKRYGYA